MKNKCRILFLMISVLLVISLTGCSLTGTSSMNNDKKLGVSLVVGTHQNFPRISLSAKNIYDKLYSMAYSYGSCSIIVSDGEPYLSANYNIEKPDKNIDEAKRKQIAKQNTAQIIVEAQNAIAKSPEFDTLSAITKSAGCLHSLNDYNLTMIVYDSGFSTAGLLNFASKNIIDYDSDKLVAQLTKLHAIPDLKNISIIWIGLGEVCGKQDKLTEDYKYKLEKIWSAIITAGGGAVDFKKDGIPSENQGNNLPKVTSIPVVKHELNIETLSMSENVLSSPIKLDNNTIKFIGDSDTFYDKNNAISLLKPIVEFLKANKSINITIIGTTASTGSDSGCKDLSLKRALACKQLMAEMGVSENQITCFGVGRRQSVLRCDDLDSNGNLIEPYASQNRAVYIFDSSSEAIKSIIAE